MSGRVLVVSADPARRRTLRDNLFLAGHAVLDVPNRSSALESCEDFAPNVVVVDLSGSKRRALERAARGYPPRTSVDTNLVRRISSRFPSILVVAVCDGDPGTSPDEAVAAGARAYVREPLCIGELLVRVDTHLGVSTRVKKLRRPVPRPRKKIVLKDLPKGPKGIAEVAAQLQEQLRDLDCADAGGPEDRTAPVLLHEASPLLPYSGETGGEAGTESGGQTSGEAGASGAPGSGKPESGAPEVVPAVVGDAGEGGIGTASPRKLADLIPAEGSADGTALIWVSLSGLDRVANLGMASYETVADALDSVLDEFAPSSERWWVGSEAVVAITRGLSSPVEAALEIKESLLQKAAALGLETDISVRVSATTRRWGEGRALFLARATGRISNGALPVHTFSAGSRPHPSVSLPANAVAVRSAARQAQGVHTPSGH